MGGTHVAKDVGVRSQTCGMPSGWLCSLGAQTVELTAWAWVKRWFYLSRKLPLDEFQGVAGILLVHQVEVVVGREQSCNSSQEVCLWTHDDTTLNAKHPQCRCENFT